MRMSKKHGHEKPRSQKTGSQKPAHKEPFTVQSFEKALLCWQMCSFKCNVQKCMKITDNCRYDIEGFGEIPVTALDDIAQNLFSDRTSDQRDDKVIEPDLITKARLEVSRRRNPSETVTIQEITAIVTRKRSYSFRKAVSASQKKVESRRSVIRAQRRPRAHSVPFKFKRKILDMFKHKDEVKSAPALPEKDTKFNCESPIMERKASFPVLTFALCCTQLFFAIFHSIDGKKPLVLPCYNTEPWRYLVWYIYTSNPEAYCPILFSVDEFDTLGLKGLLSISLGSFAVSPSCGIVSRNEEYSATVLFGCVLLRSVGHIEGLQVRRYKKAKQGMRNSLVSQ